MIEKSPKLLWGVIAFAIYFTLVGLLIFYFNTRNEDKSKHYVKKDEHRIQVALLAPQKEKVAKPKPKKKLTPKVKKKPKPKPKIKPKVNDTNKKVIKEKVVKKLKKKKDENLTKPKKLKIKKPKVKKNNKPKAKKEKPKKTIDLFSKVKANKKKLNIKITDSPIEKKQKKSFIKVTDAPSSAIERINDSLKNQKSSNSGEENAYFAKVEAMLDSWPAQSDFLGEQATVTLFIKPTGQFEFQVTSGSNNEVFSRSVMDFLKQLQGIGFGRHNAGRTYEFEVEFSTKE
jgi:protein TonB